MSASATKVLKTIKLFIGGEFPRTESGRSFAVLRHRSSKGAGKGSPDAVYAQLCLASRKDFRNAVTAAQGALGPWSGKSAYNRAQVLYRMAEMIEGKREEFVEVLRETLGQSPKAAESSVDAAIEALVYYAGWADKYQQVIGAVNPVSGPHHNFTSAEPVGVVGLIASEKFDFGTLAADIAAILASGNTLVALLSEQGAAIIAPLSEALATSDLTKGAVNLLTGSLEELGEQFGQHLELQSLSVQSENRTLLTSLRTAAAENMKRVVPRHDEKRLELERLLSFVEYKTVWHPIGH